MKYDEYNVEILVQLHVQSRTLYIVSVKKKFISELALFWFRIILTLYWILIVNVIQCLGFGSG